MNFVSKSLFQSNAAVIYDDRRFLHPENPMLTGLYSEQDSKGSRLLDDPYIKTKVLTLPAIAKKIVFETDRVVVYDQTQNEEQFASATRELQRLNEILYKGYKISALGFNFDFYYRFANVVRINDVFAEIFGVKTARENDLLDMGWQFSLDGMGGKCRETYFIKVTAPLDIAVHINCHFPLEKMLPEKELLDYCKYSYERSDQIIKSMSV